MNWGAFYNDITEFKESPFGRFFDRMKYMADKMLKGKNIAMVIAFRDFQDIEYFITRNVLLAAGARIATLSSEKGLAIGADGGEAQINLLAPDFKAENFDALVFVGGHGLVKDLDNKDFHDIAKDTVAKNKVLGAICIAPALLAKAGVLNGKKATVWSSSIDKSAIKMLKEQGAEYQEEDVIADGKIVTASGPPAAKKFGEAIISLLTSFS